MTTSKIPVPRPQPTAKGAKRLYTTTGTTAEPSGFAVTLDGRSLRTPAGAALLLPNRELAQAIAEEWAAQGERILPHSMPLMQLAATAIDRVGPARAAVIEACLRYAGTDLVCYRAEEPPELAERQHAAWHPLLAWAETTFGARLMVTRGLLPVPQPQEGLDAFRAALDGLSDFHLAGASDATGLLGSLVLALALLRGRLDADAAFAASLIDESYQAERWGLDAEAAERRRNLARDIAATARFLSLLG